ncbi:MAG TPA: acylphosphatase [Lacipirellulaceae bacterium]|jgi:acylphosphatase|nr:acylphosphatase [Lacipirellulaceae bacterium]
MQINELLADGHPLATIGRFIGLCSPASSEMKKSGTSQRRTVVYSGRVQGVGFRYTTQSIAHRYTVSGYVRNQPDSRVELVAEGEPHELDAFLGEVRERFFGHIRDERADVQPATGEFAGFYIRH